MVLILSGASLNSFLRLEGKNVDTLTESVDLLTGNVYGAHTRFDIDTNITRVDYYDNEKGANIRRIEMKEYFSSNCSKQQNRDWLIETLKVKTNPRR